VTDALIFQMPGLFANWGKLDAARNAMKADFDQQFQSKGFTILGWGDVGAAKTMSIGFEIHHPTDLQGKNCFFIAGDPIAPKMYAAIGGITAKEVTVPEILPNLKNGSIQVITVPPLAAEQLQWASMVTHINTMTTAFGIGAIIMSSARMSGLAQNLKDVLINRGHESADRLTKSIRNLDAQSFARLKTSKSAYEPSDAEKTEWREVFAKVRAQLRGSVFTPAAFDKAVSLSQ
jgi:TRAP-type C4-dicarboxylate transport system substrate-binding protein